jgi:hypothetical protein
MLELEEKKLASVSVNELRKHPGHSMIIGVAEDGSDLWKAFRKPDGTFWYITATVSFIPETLRVETGDQILDAEMVAQLRECFDAAVRIGNPFD